jgi:hypothetical protein
MFYTNILFHDTSFDPTSYPTRNMALSINIPSGTKKQGLCFTFIAYTKSKRENFQNPIAK